MSRKIESVKAGADEECASLIVDKHYRFETEQCQFKITLAEMYVPNKAPTFLSVNEADDEYLCRMSAISPASESLPISFKFGSDTRICQM